jgi:hypothetical protein
VVGGIFGGLMGTYYAIMYRSIMYIPMAAIGSGSSFGFFMGIGMIMRTEMEGKDNSDGTKDSPYDIKQIDPESGEVSFSPVYKKYIV